MPSRSSRPMLTSLVIRQTFLDFFAARGHTIVPSMPLVPGGDSTLLFTNSGMVQFKDVFLGTGTRPYSRVADSQKCLRVAGKHNDLDDVGRDDIHHTFFEMLGNWSFGDYYKAEAIPWAWTLLTEGWGVPRDRLWATCFEDDQGQIPRDDEAADLWRQQPGFDPKQVLFFGRKENFWEMADTGPCGPDSELHIDRGPEYCTKASQPGHVCRVNGDCGRFVELWNLVFIQYNRSGPTDLEPLPRKHVDTGMGFERLVSVLQDKTSTYRTDLLWPVLLKVQELLGHDDATRERLLTPYRVIADHVRAAAFLIADGVVPGNTGRNYITRMIIRRAGRFGSQAGFEKPFLADLVATAIGVYGSVYPELQRHEQTIRTTLTDEEERFRRTVDTGVAHLEDLLAKARAAKNPLISGASAFELYSTYGLPLEITRDIARESSIAVDEAGFFEAMEAHREVSGAGLGTVDLSGQQTEVYRKLLTELAASGQLPASGVEYDPYSRLSTEGPVLALVVDGKAVDSVTEGDAVGVVLPATAFYREAGGQVSDTGEIVAPTWAVHVVEMQEPIEGLFLHVGRVVRGRPARGDRAEAKVDRDRRLDIMRNHTATHLLHASLRSVLGEHARQAGSLVAPDRLRFDFTHPKAVEPGELQRIQAMVNDAILANYPLRIQVQPREKAVADGAMALFGENYGDTVRTISIGNGKRVSFELCGGTHVPATGVIGAFRILSEESVASGIRRIEAVTGRGAVELLERSLELQERLANLLTATPDNLEAQVRSLLEERRRLADELSRLRQAEAEAALAALQPEMLGETHFLAGVIPHADPDLLRRLSDSFRAAHPSHVVVLGSVRDGRPVLMAAVSPELVERGVSAADLARHAATAIEGSGGGKPTLAQAGGKRADGLPKAIEMARAWVRGRLT
ncbi:MAG TPA: alanine--tRNA ligase [Anaerolineales bacterium]|nr:alanine--tRNA ligase [Anaerolineales bacterium]